MKKLAIFAFFTIVLCAFLQLCGFRNDAGFLSGAPVASPNGGVAYVSLYFVAVVLAPIVLIANALDIFLERLTKR